MKENQYQSDDSQAQQVRQQSEYCKRVEDFARFMQKEYIDESDERSLLICAVDRSYSRSKKAVVTIVLGDHVGLLSGLADMMRDERFGELISDARALSLRDDDRLLDSVISDTRRQLRWLWAMVALIGVWAAVLVFSAVAGGSPWLTTITSLWLCAFYLWLLSGEIRPRRRRLAASPTSSAPTAANWSAPKR